MATGLTEAEAAERLAAGQRNTTTLKPVRTRDLARRESVFTIFHLNMLGLIGVQLLLGQRFAAVVTLALSLVSIGIRAIQEEISARRLRAVERSMRPRSSVIRDGRTRNIDSDQVVPGDLVAIGPGDQLQVDGRMTGEGAVIVDASLVTGARGMQRAGPGDEVLAGSVCMSGRGRLVAERVGNQRTVHARLREGTRVAARPTPLENLIARILLVLLILVALYSAILLAKFLRLDVGAPGDALADAAPVIFSLLPTGLYLMIIATYSTGTADLAREGAVVRSARSVESLAESNVICFTDVGMLSGTAVEIEPAPGHEADPDWPSSAQLRQILGDFARNASGSSPIAAAIAGTFEGEDRPVRFAAARLADDGWAAIAFDDESEPDLYMLVTPSRLGPALASAGLGAVAGATDALVLTRVPGGRSTDWGSRLGGESPVLPEDASILCAVAARRRIHPEALQVVRDFVTSGVRIKVFSAGDPDAAIAALREGGLSPGDEARLLPEGGVSRAELELLPQSAWPDAVSRHRLFGGLLPEQVAEVVRLLRESGKHVVVVGDGLTDLPALGQADLAVAQPASSQAALGQADVILLSRSPRALLAVQRRGQAMVRGLLDIMKLNLALVACSALLILLVRLLDIGFPYRSGHGSVLSVLVLTIPSMLLPMWASHGAVDPANYLRVLVRFAVPSGVLLSVAALGVYLFYFHWNGSQAVAQTATGLTLLYGGLVLLALIQPPWRDRRATILAVTLAVAGTLAPLVGLVRALTGVQFLPGVGDYLVVLLAVALWLAVLTGVWRLLPRRPSPARAEPLA